MNLSRRQFLQVSGTTLGGLMLGAYLPDTALANSSGKLGYFVAIEPDGQIIIGARGTEIGQGVKTSLPMLIAEELDVPWSRVTVKQLPYETLAADNERGFMSKYGPQGAGGSTSIPDSWQPLRQTGAKARHMLMQVAAEQWNVPMDKVSTRDGYVLGPGGKKTAYEKLAPRASDLPVPEQDVPLKQPENFKIIGTSVPVVDAKEIVTGRGFFGIDARVPGAKIAVITRCPYFEGSIDTINDKACLKVPGVQQVVTIPGPNAEEGLSSNLAAGVAVVADDTWSAIKGREALSIKWKPGPWANDSTDKLAVRAHNAMETAATPARNDGDLEAALKDGAQVFRAEYLMPFLAHSTLEPQNALVQLTDTHALFIGSTQSPSRAAGIINAMTDIPMSNIEVRIPRSGGGFGRRLEKDFVAEAVHIAKASKHAIKLIWTRPDDLRNDWYRPFGLQGLTAALDKNKKLTAWHHKVAATDRRFRIPGMQNAPEWVACLDPDAFPAGCVDNYRAEFVPLEFGLARGWWRGPLPTFAAFANQCFMDEVAHAAGQDPLQFQLNLLGKTRELDYRDHGGPKFDTGRLAAVLKKAASAIGYGRRQSKGHGIGIAGYFVFGGYAAHAMEVSVKEKQLKIHRCVVAADVGRMINPLNVEAQMMGGTIDGISTALNLEITVEQGQIVQENFPDYPHLRMANAPDVEVHLIDSDLPPGGAGEMGIPTAAPALANAIFAATGKRIRNLPIMKYWDMT